MRRLFEFPIHGNPLALRITEIHFPESFWSSLPQEHKNEYLWAALDPNIKAPIGFETIRRYAFEFWHCLLAAKRVPRAHEFRPEIVRRIAEGATTYLDWWKVLEEVPELAKRAIDKLFLLAEKPQDLSRFPDAVVKYLALRHPNDFEEVVFHFFKHGQLPDNPKVSEEDRRVVALAVQSWEKYKERMWAPDPGAALFVECHASGHWYYCSRFNEERKRYRHLNRPHTRGRPRSGN